MKLIIYYQIIFEFFIFLILRELGSRTQQNEFGTPMPFWQPALLPRGTTFEFAKQNNFNHWVFEKDIDLQDDDAIASGNFSKMYFLSSLKFIHSAG